MYLLKKLLDMSTIIFYSRKNMGERNSERSYLMRKRNIILGITNNSPIAKTIWCSLEEEGRISASGTLGSVSKVFHGWKTRIEGAKAAVERFIDVLLLQFRFIHESCYEQQSSLSYSIFIIIIIINMGIQTSLRVSWLIPLALKLTII
jgi:hypothetical protein